MPRSNPLSVFFLASRQDRLPATELSTMRTTDVLQGMGQPDYDQHFNDLVNKYWPEVHRWAHAALGSKLRRRVDSEDMVQETFLAFVEDVKRLRPKNGEEFTALLRRILHNRIADTAATFATLKRDLDREAAFSSAGWLRVEGEINAAPDPSLSLQRADDAVFVKSALFLLGPVARECLRAYFMRGDNVTMKDVAKTLGISADAFQKRFSRTMERLRVIASLLRRGQILPGVDLASEPEPPDGPE